VGVLLVSLAALAGTGEVALRLLASPLDPVEFQKRNDPAWDSDGLGRMSVAFDRHLFWRRAPPPEAPSAAAARVLILADGSACDPRHGTPWPVRLARLIDLNETARPLAIVDAAEPGYSSFQGRRRLEEVADHPELVLVGLGANDVHTVRVPDAEYERRLERLGSLAGSWLALRTAHWLWAFHAGSAEVPRVAPEETRANLAAIAARVEGWGGKALRLEKGSSPAATAGAAFDLLAERGLVLTRHGHAAEAEMAVPDGWPELGDGFGPIEAGPQGLPGRWTEAQASLTLERRGHEAGLALEVTCPAPADAAIDVNGVFIGGLGGCRGRRWYRFSLDPIAEDTLRVRLTSSAARRLFVHGLRLVPSGDATERPSDPLYASELDLQDAEDGRPELGPGWWANEVWPDGRRGRWSSREASLYLERRGAEAGLLLEATLENPDDTTSCRIEVNGAPVYSFSSKNGRHRYGVDIERVRGRRLWIRLVVERTFVPGKKDDGRSLGVFVHSVRLARSPLP
jgi:hypothetical protein